MYNNCQTLGGYAANCFISYESWITVIVVGEDNSRVASFQHHLRGRVVNVAYALHQRLLQLTSWLRQSRKLGGPAGTQGK
eukprot:1154603-Pelagomonas_calceolata.AAC.1